MWIFAQVFLLFFFLRGWKEELSAHDIGRAEIKKPRFRNLIQKQSHRFQIKTWLCFIGLPRASAQAFEGGSQAHVPRGHPAKCAHWSCKGKGGCYLTLALRNIQRMTPWHEVQTSYVVIWSHCSPSSIQSHSTSIAPPPLKGHPTCCFLCLKKYFFRSLHS